MAAPGVGKSQLWNNLAQRMRVPTLYWSADTDQHDVMVRSCAMWSGRTTEQIENDLTEDSWRDYYFDLLDKHAGHMDWVFDSAITGKLCGERLNAFAELHGEYPHLFVVDNLSNAIESVADEYAQTKEMLTAMQRLSREVNAHIAVLTHAKGEYDAGTKPIPQSGGLQNPFKTPEVGLTLYRPDEDNRLGLNIVKMRGGKSDPAARHPTVLPIDFTRAAVLGYAPEKETK